MAYFFAAHVGTASYPFLTIGAANLLRRFGDAAQQARWLPAMGDGRCAGTMAFTGRGQGSSLADIRTYAVAHPDGCECELLRTVNPVPLDMRDGWFQ